MCWIHARALDLVGRGAAGNHAGQCATAYSARPIIKPVVNGILVQLGVDWLDWMARTFMLLGCPFVVR